MQDARLYLQTQTSGLASPILYRFIDISGQNYRKIFILHNINDLAVFFGAVDILSYILWIEKILRAYYGT